MASAIEKTTLSTLREDCKSEEEAMADEQDNENIARAGKDSLDDFEGDESLFGEFWTFLMENKVWWITPCVVILSVVVLFIVITAVTGGGPIAPFIYTLF